MSEQTFETTDATASILGIDTKTVQSIRRALLIAGGTILSFDDAACYAQCHRETIEIAWRNKEIKGVPGRPVMLFRWSIDEWLGLQPPAAVDRAGKKSNGGRPLGSPNRNRKGS